MLVTKQVTFDLFHIDFGFTFGHAPLVDSNIIPFPRKLRSLMEELGMWDKFLDLSCEAFVILRRMESILIKFTCDSFLGIEDPSRIAKWMSVAFFSGKTEDEAKREMRQLLMCQDLRMDLKDFFHDQIWLRKIFV